MAGRTSTSDATTLVVAGAVGGAALLVLSLFLDWYSITVTSQSASQTQTFSGWNALELADGLFLFVLGAAIWIGAARMSGTGTQGFGWLAAISVAAVFALLVSRTPVIKLATLSGQADSSLKIGAYVAAVGAIAMALAALYDTYTRPAPAGQRRAAPDPSRRVPD